MSRREAEDLRRLVVRVAGEAASFLRDRMGVEELLEVVDVHEGDEGMRIDRESEELIIELLKAEGLRPTLVTEERGFVKLGNDPYIAVVDPLDGSRNYASLIPWCSVSIALLPSEDPKIGNTIAAAVAPVPRLPVYSMAKGTGVFEGESTVKPPRRKPKLVLAYAETVDQARRLYSYISRLPFRPSIRGLGSSSLEVVWAALGRAYSFTDVRGKLRIYDLTAALAIAWEAGAYVYVERAGSVLESGRLGVVAVTRYEDAWKVLKETVISSKG